MKKTSLANLFIIIGLLVLCVMTLIVVYATAPESSVLLLDETFSRLDENKWKHELSECNEDGELFHYDMEDGKSSELITDGVLQFHSNLTNSEFRSKRETFTNCTSCVKSKYSISDCESAVFFAAVQTRNVLDANKGRVKLRAKLQSRHPMIFCIEITPNFNNSEIENTLENFSTLKNETSFSNSSELKFFFKAVPNEALMHRKIADNEFHNYEINWDSKKIWLKIDNKEVEEKQFEVSDLAEENNSNKTVKFNSAPISQPFYLKLGVEFEKEELTENDGFLKHDLTKKNVLEVDFIQLFSILN